MRRINGGKLGVYHNTTPGQSSGVYALAEVQAMQSAGVWPGFPGDANFANVVLCSHFRNQLNDSKMFPSSGSLGNIITQMGTNSTDGSGINPGQSKWYTASWLCAGAGSAGGALRAQAVATFGTGDFTVELWFYPTSASSGLQLLDFRGAEPSITPLVYQKAASTGVLEMYVNGAAKITSAASAITNNAWNFIAISRVSGNTRMYCGTSGSIPQVGSTYVDANNYVAGSNLTIGESFTLTATPALNTWFQEVRVTTGVGRYSRLLADLSYRSIP